MLPIYKHYLTSTCGRYDKDIAIPYYSNKDFPSLNVKESTFTNRDNYKIHYFYYYYDNFRKDKIILFLTGIGPGHTAHYKEIDTLAKFGYKVLTLDYTGTDKSEGMGLMSLNQPTRDVLDLLDYLKLKEDVVVVGHSLGGYTALNILKIRNEVKKGVILSGFISIYRLLKIYVPKFVATIIARCEKKYEKGFEEPKMLDFLSTTEKEILFIHSIDDKKVDYKSNFTKVKKLNNPHLLFITEKNKNHNPNYTVQSVKYKDEVIDRYFKLLKEEKLTTIKQRKEYFKDIDIHDITEQDMTIMNNINDFIKK